MEANKYAENILKGKGVATFNEINIYVGIFPKQVFR